MSSIEDVWSEFDHKRAEAELGIEQSTLRRITLAELNRLREARHDQGFAGPTGSEILEVLRDHLGKYAESIWKVCQGVWHQQGRELIPDFISAVASFAVVPLLQTERDECVSVAERVILNWGLRGLSLSEATESLTAEASWIIQDWKSQLEVKASHIEYQGKSKQGKTSQVFAKGTRPNRKTERTRKLEKAVKQICDELQLEGVAKASTKQILEGLASRKKDAPLPKRWTTRFQKWSEVRDTKNYLEKRRADRFFSKMRKEFCKATVASSPTDPTKATTKSPDTTTS